MSLDEFFKLITFIILVNVSIHKDLIMIIERIL